ncbi:MAG: serine/threonine protein kinase [Deltaproteobacteria bacterium]|nr:serine/threonine protein kinase [Deltaproteobacteria bacterium]
MNTEEKNPSPDSADTTQADSGIAVGSILDGRYEILEQFGEGGVGLVYRARHIKLGLTVAIKVLQEQFVLHKMMRPRFEREARALATLAHPNIVSVNDFGIADGRPYLVMELLEGQTLRELLNRGPLPIDQVTQVTRQLLNALAYAHAHGFVHRDLKPSNVFIQHLPDRSLHIKILDFGMVKFVDQETHDGSRSLTRSGMAVGTPSYMAPEQVIGDRIGTSTDVYAIGILLFEMLTGRAPFTGELADIVRRQLTDKIPALGQANAHLEVSAELEALIQRAVDKNPSRRYPNAASLLKAFEALPNPPAMRKDVSLDATIAASWNSAATFEATRPIDSRKAASSKLRALRTAARWAGILFIWLGKAVMRLAQGLFRLSRWLVKGLFATIKALYRVAKKAGPRKVAWAMFIFIALALGTWFWLDGGARRLLEPRRGTSIEKPATLKRVRTAIEEKLRGLIPATEQAAESAADLQASESTLLARDDRDESDTEPARTATSDSSKSAGANSGNRDRSRPAAANPWADRKVPRILAAYRKRIFRGEKLSEKALKSLRDYQRNHRSDPRPSLLLARAYMVLGWYRDAVERYLLAYKLDARSRGDKHMERDLLEIVRYPKLSYTAAQAVLEIYGAEALKAIDRDLASSSVDDNAKTALRRLRERIVEGARGE